MPRSPAIASVTVTYKGNAREVLYRPTASIYALLTDAVRTFGLKFAANSHLRLFTDTGKPLTPVNQAKRPGITPGAQLTLAATDPHQATA